MGQKKQKKTKKNMMTCRVAAQLKTYNASLIGNFSFSSVFFYIYKALDNTVIKGGDSAAVGFCFCKEEQWLKCS